MNLIKYFEYSPSIDLNASHIGINKWNWIASTSNNNEVEARRIMSEYRFDVLPISIDKKPIKSFYKTSIRNDFTSIEIGEITEKDKIYYRLSFEDLIRKFYQEDRYFYFLTNYQEVLGLVSLVNLNSQPVYSYIFQLVSSIERNLSELLQEQLKQEDVIKAFEGSSDEVNKKIAETFKKSKAEGKENTIFQHMYLHNIGYLLGKFENDLNEKSRSLINYREKFSTTGLYIRIRNTVMHPVKPVLNENVSLADLNEFFNDYHQLISIVSEE